MRFNKLGLLHKFIHYKFVSYGKPNLPHSSGEFKCRAMLLPWLYTIYMFGENGLCMIYRLYYMKIF